MKLLPQIIAAHPLKLKPYHSIRFVRLDGNGTPLYVVGKDKKERGAIESLRAVFEKQGAHCFLCDKWMKPQALSRDCTLDHLRPRHDGGGDFLYNLVFSCGPCNRSKAGKDIVDYKPDVGSKYLKALDAHLSRCLRELKD